MNEGALVPSLGPINFVFNRGDEQSCGVEQSCKSLGLIMDQVSKFQVLNFTLCI
jgi:hypothetical protein